MDMLSMLEDKVEDSPFQARRLNVSQNVSSSCPFFVFRRLSTFFIMYPLFQLLVFLSLFVLNLTCIVQVLNNIWNQNTTLLPKVYFWNAGLCRKMILEAL